MTENRVTVSTSVNVDANTTPSLYVDENGAHLSVRSEDRGGSLYLYSQSLGGLLAFLGAAHDEVSARYEAQAPVLPLEDVLSTHPEAVAG